MQKVYLRKNAREASKSGPIQMSERFQFQLATLPCIGIALSVVFLGGHFG